MVSEWAGDVKSVGGSHDRRCARMKQRRKVGTRMAIEATVDQQEPTPLSGETQMRSQSVQELLNDRHALDAIARAIVSGERGLGDAEDAIADAVASLMINRLDAAGV